MAGVMRARGISARVCGRSAQLVDEGGFIGMAHVPARQGGEPACGLLAWGPCRLVGDCSDSTLHAASAACAVWPSAW